MNEQMTKISYQINYTRRLIGTALGFSLFGAGGIILCFTLIPLVHLFSTDKVKGSRRVRFIIGYVFSIYLKILNIFGVLKIKSETLEAVKKCQGVLVICNHPSLLDVVIIMAHLKDIQCVVKNNLWTNPFIGGVVRAAGYIRNDLAPEEFLKNCKRSLTQGCNIIIFPEGTRSTPGEPLKLQRGMSNLALAIRADIQTLTLDCAPISLTKKDKWYKIPVKKIIFNLKVGPYIQVANYEDDKPRSLRVRALTKDIQHFYNKHLGYE